MWVPGGGRRRLPSSIHTGIASGSAPCRQSPGITSGRSPSRPASWAHSAAKCPVSAISTASPGDRVLTRAASQAPVPDEGKMTTGSSVPKTRLISVLLSKISVFSCYCRSVLCSVLYTALPPRVAITGPSASKSHGRSDTSLKLAGVAYGLHGGGLHSIP